MPRRIGLDVHREFAQIAVWEDGVVRQAGQIATTPEALRVFADSLLASDEVAIEATGNTHAIAKLIAPRVARVVISNLDFRCVYSTLLSGVGGSGGREAVAELAVVPPGDGGGALVVAGVE